MPLEYVAAKAARAVRLLETGDLKEAIRELAIGMAYLTDHLRRVEPEPPE